MWPWLLHEPPPIRGLLLFKPEKIRVDEWWTVTPSMLAQARHVPPFPIANENLGGGRAPLLMSVPVLYYTTFFRPQLWGFFLFDFEHGFSFYWCCKVFGLLFAWAWLMQQVGIKSRAIVTFGTAWLFFSSFMQWWFSSPAMLPEMLACWAMMTGCALIFFSSSKRGPLVLAFCGFVFFGANFVLCLYPGFQVPLLYVTAAILIGKSFEGRSANDWRAGKGLAILGVALLALGLLLVPFYRDVRETLDTVAHTYYPGIFRNHGGGLSLFQLFSGVLGFFESEQKPPTGYNNICEASNFYPLWVPVMLMLTVVACWRRIGIPPLIIALATAIIVTSIYCLVPVPVWLAHGSLLAFSDESRILLGLGVANILLCCVFFDSMGERILTDRIVPIVFACLCIGVAILAIGSHVDHTRFVLLALANAVIIGLFFWERARSGFLVSFAALIVMNGAPINPVMRGLSALVQSPAFAVIDRLHRADADGRWLVYEKLEYAQLVKATGAEVLNGAKIVPDLDLMRQLDPDGRYESIYNRYANVRLYLPDGPEPVWFANIAIRGFAIMLPPDLPLLKRGGYRYAMFPRPWLDASLYGFSLVEEIEPAGLYIYKSSQE
jgi:hypothetical protein